MASNFDLQEQEQIDQLKHFWKQYGNAITWLLIVVLGGIAAWNFWHQWQRKQAAEAAVMYDEVERAARAGDVAKLERSLADIKDRYGSTTYAQHAALLAARGFDAQKQADKAQAALTWVAEKAGDEGLAAVARLRLAGLLLEAKSYDAALKQLDGQFTPEFAALAEDRRGDILLAQGKAAEARAAYQKAYTGMDKQLEYRLLVEVKLNALGGEAVSGAAK